MLPDGGIIGVMSSDASVAAGTLAESFTRFMDERESGLKHALVAGFGRELGLEAAAEAWAYGWEHWERIRLMDNPAGFLWGVGRNKARLAGRGQSRSFPMVPNDQEYLVEPALPKGLERLSERQRITVLLKHGYGWTYAEISELLDVSIPSLQKHAERGMTKLRRTLGAEQ